MIGAKPIKLISQSYLKRESKPNTMSPVKTPKIQSKMLSKKFDEIKLMV